jgi:hypothetical protein
MPVFPLKIVEPGRWQTLLLHRHRTAISVMETSSWDWIFHREHGALQEEVVVTGQDCQALAVNPNTWKLMILVDSTK